MNFKNINNILLKVAIVGFISAASIECYGQSNIFKGLFGTKETKETQDSKEKQPTKNLKQLTFDEIVLQSKVGKYAPQIKDYQKGQAIAIKTDQFKTELMRNGEVIIVSIPTADLFLPMDSILTKSGEAQLLKFVKFLNIPNFYHVLLVMNSDNTGSPSYIANLSNTRVKNISNWFKTQTQSTEYLFPFSMGSRMPIVPNNSMENRALNRRLEIYLVPGDEMINQAKKGMLQFLKTY